MSDQQVPTGNSGDREGRHRLIVSVPPAKMFLTLFHYFLHVFSKYLLKGHQRLDSIILGAKDVEWAKQNPLPTTN